MTTPGCNLEVFSYDDQSVSFDDLLIAYDGVEDTNNEKIGLAFSDGDVQFNGNGLTDLDLQLGLMPSPFTPDRECV